jgi:hypothetical protein
LITANDQEKELAAIDSPRISLQGPCHCKLLQWVILGGDIGN